MIEDRAPRWHMHYPAQGGGDLIAVGVTYVEGTVRAGPAGEGFAVRFLVDSGAKFTLLPHSVWTRLALAPKRRETFEMADGTLIERHMSECHVTFEFGHGHTPVILGEPGDEIALLGVITLEEFGLVFDPLRRSLQRSRALLLLVS